jgi:hypothetical protein
MGEDNPALNDVFHIGGKLKNGFGCDIIYLIVPVASAVCAAERSGR